MPLIILLKAACTALDGEACPVGAVLFWVAGDASSSVDLVTRFGVGEGFGATVRVRDGVGEEFVFCAGTKAALTSTTERTTINLFTIIISSDEPFAVAGGSIEIHARDAGYAGALLNPRGRRSQRLQTLTVPPLAPSTWCAKH